VELCVGDGLAARDDAFDAVYVSPFVTARAALHPLLRAVRPGGVLVAPVGAAEEQTLFRVTATVHAWGEWEDLGTVQPGLRAHSIFG